jgi:uncharacterized protein (DUF433 family)
VAGLLDRDGYQAVPRKTMLRYNDPMKSFARITFDPQIMGGKACIRGLRVTVGTILGLLAAGRTRAEILRAYPYLESEDIDQALAYAAWRVEEREAPLVVAST